MSTTFGVFGPRFPRLGRAVRGVSRPVLSSLFRMRDMHPAAGRYAMERLASLRAELAAGRSAYLVGIGASGHNSGVALVEVSPTSGLRVICNEEEERYQGLKHYTGFPEHSVEVLKERLRELGLGPRDVHAFCTTWDYVEFLANGGRLALEHFPLSLGLLSNTASPHFNPGHAMRAAAAPRRLGRQLGLAQSVPIIQARHHDNHAYFSYAASPFGRMDEPVMVSAMDSFGDDSAISLYVGQSGRLRLWRKGENFFDSLGTFYSILSTFQGGWTALSSEGRYMGAAAWGNGDRLTNPYYGRLRELIHLGPQGQIYLNRAMANWHRAGELWPYRRALRDVLGPPLARSQLWNPDAILRVEDIEHSEVTRDRVDQAAATQLVFEDALLHVLGDFIRATGSDKLVLTGGTALNCVANMRLLEHFDEAYYERYVGRRTQLRLWVPPVPGDAGVPIGAAYQFAMRAGAVPGEPLQHAFYCGRAAERSAIDEALSRFKDVAVLELGNASTPAGRERIADFAAFAIARDAVLGLYQGPAETGPRALGHRSILANPCNPHTLEVLNTRVKFRERIRPLAPMATREAAERFFELAPGASDDDYNAYSYMVLTARARPEARRAIPAVIHHDGTARVQIVRPQMDPLTHAILRAMGRRAGVEVLVNTSLNVGSPIAQTPEQAIQVALRAKALSALLMIAAEGDALLVWHNVDDPPKDGGRQLLAWHRAWSDTEKDLPAAL
jgi:carbamoyltransferase